MRISVFFVGGIIRILLGESGGKRGGERGGGVVFLYGNDLRNVLLIMLFIYLFIYSFIYYSCY